MTPAKAARPAARKTAVQTRAAKPIAKPAARRAAAAPAVKSAAPAKPATKAAPAVPVAKESAKPRLKLVRDSFTMPQQDFDLVAAMKKRALAFQRPARKSELLRAGLQALHALDNTALKAALERLTPVKAGRPRKHA